ncbi:MULTISPECIES: bifunctional diguanylate cyclase/phosphodiesterase [unclassified Roseovarius]|uniref:putative bifunctional diguanylate cyclase/phosphodiesterase n=1 Tax=unclassified Roseovarius TaxID=2614913 RepID=UPI00273E191A|nr:MULTISPECIES: EAL domain-containing protein [unclassified Roseovarius]
MIGTGKITGRLDRILDRFASRLGIISVVGLLFVICAAVGFYVQTVVSQLEFNHSKFRDQNARNGYVALSDIHRLLMVTQKAVNTGEMTPELKSDFANATDVLFVRLDSLRASIAQHEEIRSAPATINSLDQIIEIADAAIAEDSPDIDLLMDTLLAAAVDARSHLVQFLDDMRRQADKVLDKQSRAVRKQQVVVLANLTCLTLIGSVALLLLRREVLGRRARESAEARVEFLAFFDPLTRLPNRSQFQDRLERMLKDDRPLALLFIDLDEFKMINDTYGHAAGDAVLKHVGGVLSKLANENKGFAARLGGDEYAIVVPSDHVVRLTSLCQRILSDVAAPFSFESESFEIGLSIGLATSTQVSQNETVTLDLLSRVTDFALYASKSAGRGCYTFYNHELEGRYQERRDMLEELPGAIQHGDLEVHLQPKVTLVDKKVFGFEALVRWRRGGQLVPPNQFILIAEESGMVVDIDHFVLRNATKMVADWNTDHGTDFSVSVNLSALHFTSVRIVEWVQDALWSSLLNPSRLTLEITETMEMRDWKQARSVISGLRKLGCKIAIDDFGTGYSSLAYLRTTSADELKIDRSLVEELESSEKARLLLTSVMDIARNLEFEVTVEGIETDRQGSIVTKMGAQNGQGYFFGRPEAPEAAFSAAMNNNRPSRQMSPN